MVRPIIQAKIDLVESLTQKFKDAKTVVVFEYQGLSVFNFTSLRTELRNNNVEIHIYKNNITRRAAAQAGFENLVSELTGPLAVAVSFDDVVAPAKVINDFAKTQKKVVLRAGIIEGVVASKAEVIALANIPSRETLLTQLAAGLLHPVKELAIGLNMLTEQN